MIRRRSFAGFGLRLSALALTVLLASMHAPRVLAQPVPVLVRTVGSGAGSSQIWHIQPSTCATRQIGDTGTSGLGSLAKDSSQRLFSVNYSAVLVGVNPTTGAATPIVNVVGLDYPSVRALTFAASGDLLAVTQNPAQWDEENHLYRINTSTGQASLVGAMKLIGIQGLATAPDGRIFAWDMGGHPFWSAGLVLVNPSTGATTDINTSDNYDGLNGNPVKPDLQTLAFSPDGTLYGIGNGNVYVVNQSTGEAILQCFGITQGDGMGAEFVRAEWPRPIDVWLKDCPADQGSVPSAARCPQWWMSPDISSMTSSGGIRITARVRNRGQQPARPVRVAFLYWDLTSVIGRPVLPGSLAASAVEMGRTTVAVPLMGITTSINWTRPLPSAWCLGVVLGHAEDQPSNPLRLPPSDNNFAIRCSPNVSERMAWGIR